MSFENWIALIGVIAVLIYLVFTMLRPERF
jgi:K+-transporting ATPase KdpF subunit